jgi:hypothetical protein
MGRRSGRERELELAVKLWFDVAKGTVRRCSGVQFHGSNCVEPWHWELVSEGCRAGGRGLMCEPYEIKLE